MSHDPGRGSWEAPIGSEEWAKRLRLAMVSTAQSLSTDPKRFLDLYKKMIEARAWTVLRDADGNLFRDFDAFCRYRMPWGLGRPWEEIRPFLLGVAAPEELNVATAEPGRTLPGPGRGHKKQPAIVAGCLPSADGPGDDRSMRMFRAIAERTPEPARNLYRAGLLGVVEAAKLGPKNPTPDQAARVTEVARELVAVAESVKNEPKPKAKRVVTAKARELLGVRRDRVTEALRLVEAMNEDERDALKEALSKRWPTIWENAS